MSKYCSKYLSHKKLNAIEFQCNMKSIQLNKSFKSMNQSQSMSEPMVPLLYLCASSIPACTGQGGVYPSMHWAEGCSNPSMHWKEGCLPGGGGGSVCPGGGVYPGGGECLTGGGGVSAQWVSKNPGGYLSRMGVLQRWGVCLGVSTHGGGVCPWRGCIYLGGVCLWGLSACGRVVCPGGREVSAQGVKT